MSSSHQSSIHNQSAKSPFDFPKNLDFNFSPKHEDPMADLELSCVYAHNEMTLHRYSESS
jgi:hypothetical protein